MLDDAGVCKEVSHMRTKGAKTGPDVIYGQILKSFATDENGRRRSSASFLISGAGS